MRHLIITLVAGFYPLACSAESNLERAWKLADTFEYNKAFEVFQESPERSIRESRFGAALSRLNSQPRADRNAREALLLFEELAKEHEKDLVGVLSQYFAGRIYQLYLDDPEPEKAVEYFQQVLALRSGIPLAETAASSIVLIHLSGPSTNLLNTLAELEPLLFKLKSNVGKREFHTTMGFAYLEFAPEGDTAFLERALDHLRKADSIGASRWQTETSIWIAIAEASRALGDTETALRYYNQFAEKYKRDRRNELVQTRIKELRMGERP